MEAKLDAALQTIQQQQEKIEELEDMVQALLNCYKDVEARLDDTFDGDSVPLYGSCYGYLQKLSGGIAGSKWKRRWCVLENDGILYYWKTAAAATDPSADKGVIPLAGYSLNAASDDTDLTLRLVGPHKKSYEFHAESRSDKQRWVTAITEQLERMEIDSTGGMGRRQSVHRGRAISRSSTVGRTSPVNEINSSLLETCTFKGWVLRYAQTGWTRAYAVLDADVLYMYKSARDAAGALVLYLADATLSPIYPRDDLFTFEIRTASGGAHTFGFPDEGACKKWLEHLSASTGGTNASSA
ncbi:hypothetical protein PTSG_08585 [Salpingoeca rosetta]|uniref:PH domain-containing protein n=1 Tax=Salpingoeca rosetta (strain ATCC 50818 / BSB-021) TaxID=946362 RepID=F2UK39_SALR5|nr:uncharacterized protein PTSG_08585 [Salpingoeca rosetta]EGD77488.1 hypothetical protein PTSG_08585 [Salpingoeca rosetta]|eukprot:XP_004990376.1 hypothetical protein PTSG_08585 [Salpingoeca rosetta]